MVYRAGLFVEMTLVVEEEAGKQLTWARGTCCSD
jgi:hypothetical protein